MGIKRIEKIRNEEIRAQAGVANINDKIRVLSDNEMVGPRGEKDRGRCNEKMEDRSDSTPRDRKTKPEMERCYMKIHEGEIITEREEAQDRRTWRMETICRSQKAKRQKN